MENKSFHGVPLVALPPDISRILFVGNLDSSVTGETLYRVFHKYGALRQVRVGNTPETENTAIVIFESVFDSQRAQSHLNGLVVKKGAKPMIVNFFDERKIARAKKAEKQRRQRQEQLSARQEELAAAAAAAKKVAASEQA